MKAEELFTSVIESYKSLLSIKGSSTPGLRAYCVGRQISYRDFLIWATDSEIATGLKEIESRRKRIKKKNDIEAGVAVSPKSSCRKATKSRPLLYPLHIITDVNEPVDEAISNPALLLESQNIQPVGSVSLSSRLLEHPVLSGIRIAFPNGVKMSIREADSYGLYLLVYGM